MMVKENAGPCPYVFFRKQPRLIYLNKYTYVSCSHNLFGGLRISSSNVIESQSPIELPSRTPWIRPRGN